MMTTVAHRHFVGRQTKSDIADSLGVSRFKVARLIEEAIASGVVRFTIAELDEYDTELAEALSARFGLRHAVVLRGPNLSAGQMTEALGRAAAALLEETLVDGQTLAVAWGRTLSACAQALTKLPAVDVVQAIGSMAGGEYVQSSVELVHRLAALSRGQAYPLYLPMWLEDPSLVERLRNEPSIARATARFAHVDVLVSGIGAWNPPQSTLFATLPLAWQEQAQVAGTSADLCSVLLDADGRPVVTPLAENLIGMTVEQIRAAPTVIGVAGGIEKAEAISAVLRGRWLTTLITDATVGQRLLGLSLK
ncbi:sugar-binding transcriptional regulator [Acidisoma silvae]|nr:sugar-binding domain-containing protein [Acidisoma silvae]